MTQISRFPDYYFIFDFPGQIELYLSEPLLPKLIHRLNESISLVSLGLFDAGVCYDSWQYISITLIALILQMNLETPHLNVFSKIDLWKEFGRLPYRIGNYFDLQASEMIIEDQEALSMEGSLFEKRFQKLNSKMKELVSNENPQGFFPLDIRDKKNVCMLVGLIDKANGFYYYKENQKGKFVDLRLIFRII